MIEEEKEIVFGKKNYRIMFLGLFVLIFGFLLLSGGGSDQAEVFDAEVFNARRLVWAPTVIILGFVIEVFAIVAKPNKKY